MTPQVAIFDSGIGGTGVLNHVRGLAPWADLVYVADHAFGPYGERSLTEVRSRTEILARYLDSAGVEVVVIACNSASAAALHHLREVMPDMAFVGMEPAVKPATELTTTGTIGVMATAATFQGELFKALIGKHGDEVTVVEQACPGLAAAVEAGHDVGPLLDEFLPPLIEAGVDVIVLGCTHYPIIRDQIEVRLPDDTKVIDPAAAVARQVVEVAHEHDVDLKGVGSTRFWSTATPPGGSDLDWEPVGIPASSLGAMRAGETSIISAVGDVTTLHVDAITNAANNGLQHGGGIALAIAHAGAPDVDEESRAWIEEYGPLTPGVAALTSAGPMPSSYVIHVAGPIHDGSPSNEEDLAAAVLAAIDMATELEIGSLAMPAISAGIYGYPPDEATRVITETAAETLSESDTTLRTLHLVGYDLEMASRFASAIREMTSSASLPSASQASPPPSVGESL